MDELSYSANHVYREGYEEGLKDGLAKADNMMQGIIKKMEQGSYIGHSKVLAEQVKEQWKEIWRA
jgi:hypothetical protein